jgi:hypothetical protein
LASAKVSRSVPRDGGLRLGGAVEWLPPKATVDYPGGDFVVAQTMF